MEKIIKLEGKKIGLKASAGTVRAYRDYFGRDILKDMGELEEEILKRKTMSTETTAIAENVLWIMAREYDPDIPEITEWLGDFSPMFIYEAIVHVIYMWRLNSTTLNKSAKKAE